MFLHLTIAAYNCNITSAKSVFESHSILCVVTQARCMRSDISRPARAC